MHESACVCMCVCVCVCARASVVVSGQEQREAGGFGCPLSSHCGSVAVSQGCWHIIKDIVGKRERLRGGQREVNYFREYSFQMALVQGQ